MPHLNNKNLSPEEQAKRKAELEEKSLVENMLTRAAEWYHKQLENYPEIKKHLQEHYGFSADIINEQMIGYAPVSAEGANSSELYQHLNSIPEFKGKLHLSGLFSFDKPKGDYYDFFKGRIIFPYWKNGKVVYMGARATKHTPVTKFECYTDKEGNIKFDENNNPIYIKYKKLRIHKPDGDKAKYISKFIQNDTFIGEDSIRGAKEIIITEGIPDAISALDKGFKVISPATISFSNNTYEKLDKLTKHSGNIYIINDNETSKAGEDGAMKTGQYLASQGRNVFIVDLPLPEGAVKIDLNEYLKSNSAEDLYKLMGNSKSVIASMIDRLPKDFEKAEPTIIKDIMPIMIELIDYKQLSYKEKIKRQCGISISVLDKMYESVTKDIKLKKIADSKKWVASPEMENDAKKFAYGPFLFRRRIDAVGKSGVAGERMALAMYFAILDSRLLVDDNPLALKNAGHYGAGKSYPLYRCLKLYPKSAYFVITAASDKSFYYLKEDMAHKAIIVNEAYEFQSNNADSALSCVLRSFISEGEINYQAAEKTDGVFETNRKHIKGPISFITTTIMQKLEKQIDDRLITIRPDESVEQTKAVIDITGKRKTGSVRNLTDKEYNTWVTFHNMLKPVKVEIPFAEIITAHINKQTNLEISYRRDIEKILTLIQAVACTHQFQREKNEEGSIIADYIDYWIALQLWSKTANEETIKKIRKSDKGSEDEKKLSDVLSLAPVKMKKLEEKWNVSNTAVSNWIGKMVEEGSVRWCKSDGSTFTDDAEKNKFKSAGKGYVDVINKQKQMTTKSLPTVFEITGDDDWAVGGKLYEAYDLKLDLRNIDDECQDAKVVSMGNVNTPEVTQTIENIEQNDNDELSVKASMPITEDSCKEEDTDKDDDDDFINFDEIMI
jgi:hypothetical protein